jgi:hypothetical protein
MGLYPVLQQKLCILPGPHSIQQLTRVVVACGHASGGGSSCGPGVDRAIAFTRRTLKIIL